MKDVKDTILSLAIIAVFVLLLLERCNNKKADATPPTSTITAKSDTNSVAARGSGEVHQSPQPIINLVIPPTQQQAQGVDRIIYQNDTAAMRKLMDNYFSSKVVSRTFKIDTIGNVTTTDTVTQNDLKGGAFTYNLKYPIITNTVTIKEPYKPHGKLYAGGGIGGTEAEFINQFKAGLLYQDAKDRVFKANVLINTKGQWGAEAETYWKIRLKR